MEKAFLSTQLVFSVEVENPEVTETHLETEFYEVVDVRGMLEVTLSNGKVHMITAEELGRVMKCVGITEV